MDELWIEVKSGGKTGNSWLLVVILFVFVIMYLLVVLYKKKKMTEK